MSAKIQRLAEVDRIIHEPARLMVVALLSAVKEADFQYLHQSTRLVRALRLPAVPTELMFLT